MFRDTYYFGPEEGRFVLREIMHVSGLRPNRFHQNISVQVSWHLGKRSQPPFPSFGSIHRCREDLSGCGARDGKVYS